MSDFNNIEKKIKDLRTLYRNPEDKAHVDNLEKQLRKNLAKAQIAEIPEIKELIVDTQRKIQDINLMLQWDRELTQDERLRLMDERKIHLRWIERLDPSQATAIIRDLEKFVDTKITEATPIA
jgi:hypothetical protein